MNFSRTVLHWRDMGGGGGGAYYVPAFPVIDGRTQLTNHDYNNFKNDKKIVDMAHRVKLLSLVSI